MNFIVKNNYLYIGEFILKCAIGKGGIKKNKIEGDGSTPRGIFKIGKLFYRQDRVSRPECLLKTIKIRKNFKWCDDYRSRYYNKLIRSNKKDKFSFENLYRTDFKYNYIILIEYNYPKPVKKKGSAIFIHLTKTYKPTTGCVTLRKKDFIILCKLINNKTKIKII